MSFCWWETGAWPERAGLRCKKYHFPLSPNIPQFQGSIQLLKQIQGSARYSNVLALTFLLCSSDLKLFKDCSRPEAPFLFFGFNRLHVWPSRLIHVTNWILSSHGYFTHSPSLHEKLLLLRKAYHCFFTLFSKRLEGTHTVHEFVTGVLAKLLHKVWHRNCTLKDPYQIFTNTWFIWLLKRQQSFTGDRKHMNVQWKRCCAIF